MVYSPYVVFYLRLYFFLFFCLIGVRDFFLFFVLIETLILLLVGVGLTLPHTATSLIVFFLIQTFASFSIFARYTLGYPSLILLFLVLKVAMFPVFSWFLCVAQSLSPLVLFFSLTLHKVPSFILLTLFLSSYSLTLSWVLCAVSLLLRGVLMFKATSVLSLIIRSSFGNNSWILLASFCGLLPLVGFVFVYALLLILLFSSSREGPLFLSLSFSRGLPPSPLFFYKLFLVYTVVSIGGFRVGVLLFLISASLLVVGYLCLALELIRSKFSWSSSLLVCASATNIWFSVLFYYYFSWYAF